MDLVSIGQDTGQAYRWQAWTSRILAVVSCVLGLVVIAQTAALISLFPLKEIQPMLLVGGSQDDRVWRVEPFTVGTSGWDVIAKKQSEHYVVLRETIDLQTEQQRWQEVAWLSSDDVFTEFRSIMGRSNPNSPFERAREERLTRSIEPIATTLLNPRQVQVEFRRRDFRAGEEIQRVLMIATITLDWEPQSVRTEDLYLNPTGWQAVAYGLTAKSEGER